MHKKTTEVTILFLLAWGLVLAQTGQAGETAYVDTHSHLNAKSKQRDQQQGGEMRNIQGKRPLGRKGDGARGQAGRQPQADTSAAYIVAAEAMLADMDKYGIQKALIMPPPQIQQQGDVCKYEDLATVVRKHPGRLYFLGGGDNLNRMIHQYKPTEITPDISRKFSDVAGEIIRAGAKGFGEMAVLHLSLISSHHAYEETSADHPLFLLLADIAAQNGVPIDLHMEAVPQDMKLPETAGNNSDKNPPTLHANIPGFERLLAHNKNAKIVWQHIGWDNTGEMTVELLRRLLGAYPNIYCSLRGEEHILYRDGQPKPNRIIDRVGKVRQEWLKLISDFPDRFMAGTDDFFGASIPTASGKALPTTSKETWGIVKQLPADLAEKVGRRNAARIYNLD